MLRTAALLIPLLATVFAGPVRSQPLEALAYIRVGETDAFSQSRRELETGTGFLVDRLGHIITAKHVISPRTIDNIERRWISVALGDKNAPAVDAQLVACDVENIDLCLIKIPEATISRAKIENVFRLSCRHLPNDERIYALGFPFGSHNQSVKVWGSITGPIGTRLKYPSDVQIVPQMSGGPVLDQIGNVVAVNVGGVKDFPTMTFLQPLFYGEPLVRRSGVACSATGVAAPIRTFHAVNPDALPPGSQMSSPAITCLQREKAFARVHDSQNGLMSIEKSHVETIKADPGCRITSVIVQVQSEKHSTGPSISFAPRGAEVQLSYALRSGPFFDRYQGSIKLRVLVNQEEVVR